MYRQAFATAKPPGGAHGTEVPAKTGPHRPPEGRAWWSAGAPSAVDGE
ncbi:hypothetical protein ABZ816_32165 [Actinosynnema sp. NPDC047251]|nr:hypothetical protein [Saccharothrix espanaensis]